MMADESNRISLTVSADEEPRDTKDMFVFEHINSWRSRDAFTPRSSTNRVEPSNQRDDVKEVDEGNKMNKPIGSMSDFLNDSLIRNDIEMNDISDNELDLSQISKLQQPLTFDDALKSTKVIGFYFAKYSNPASRAFTISLKRAHSKWMEYDIPIEIIFVSQNEDAEEFNADFAEHHGKWLALRWNGHKRQSKRLMAKWDIDGIPSLVFVTKDWDIVSKNGIITVSNNWKHAAKELQAKYEEIEEGKRREQRRIKKELENEKANAEKLKTEKMNRALREQKDWRENGSEEDEGYMVPTRAGPDPEQESMTMAQCSFCVPFTNPLKKMKTKWREKQWKEKPPRPSHKIS